MKSKAAATRRSAKHGRKARRDNASPGPALPKAADTLALGKRKRMASFSGGDKALSDCNETEIHIDKVDDEVITHIPAHVTKLHLEGEWELATKVDSLLGDSIESARFREEREFITTQLDRLLEAASWRVGDDHNGISLTSRGIIDLVSRCPNLELLELQQHQQLHATEFSQIGRLTKLESLTMSHCATVEDGAIFRLAESKSLQRLRFFCTGRFTADVIEGFKRFPNLKLLDLGFGAGLSPQDQNRLVEALPRTHVIFHNVSPYWGRTSSQIGDFGAWWPEPHEAETWVARYRMDIGRRAG